MKRNFIIVLGILAVFGLGCSKIQEISKGVGGVRRPLARNVDGALKAASQKKARLPIIGQRRP